MSRPSDTAIRNYLVAKGLDPETPPAAAWDVFYSGLQKQLGPRAPDEETAALKFEQKNGKAISPSNVVARQGVGRVASAISRGATDAQGPTDKEVQKIADRAIETARLQTEIGRGGIGGQAAALGWAQDVAHRKISNFVAGAPQGPAFEGSTQSEGRELDQTLREGRFVLPAFKPRAEGEVPKDLSGGWYQNPAGTAWSLLTSFGGLTGPSTYGRPGASIAKAAHFLFADPVGLMDVGLGAVRAGSLLKGAAPAAMRMMKGLGTAEFRSAPGMLLHTAVVPGAEALETAGLKQEMVAEVADVLNKALAKDPSLQELAYVRATADPEASLLGGSKTRSVDLRGAIEARAAQETGALSPRLQEHEAKLMALFPDPEQQATAKWLLENHTGVLGEGRQVPHETIPAPDLTTPTPAPGEAPSPPGAPLPGGTPEVPGSPLPVEPPAAPPAPKRKKITPPAGVTPAAVTHSYDMTQLAEGVRKSGKGAFTDAQGNEGYGFAVRWEETGRKSDRYTPTSLSHTPEGMVPRQVQQVEVGFSEAKGWHIRKWYHTGDGTPRPAKALLEQFGLSVDPTSPTLIKVKGKGAVTPDEAVVQEAKKLVAKGRKAGAPTNTAPTAATPEARAAAAARTKAAARAEQIAATDAKTEKASWETAEKYMNGRFGHIAAEEYDQLDATGLKPPPPRAVIHEGAVRGPAIELTLPGGRKIQAHREIVDMRQIDGSNTRNGLPSESFPAPMQPRTMDIAKVEKAASVESFSIPSALADDPTGANGPPQIVAGQMLGAGRGMVANGNHRLQALKIAIEENGLGEAWKAAVKDRAKQWGLPEAEAAKALKKFGANAHIMTVIDEPHPRWSDLFTTSKDLQARVDFGFTEANQALMHAHYLEPFYRRATFPVELSVEEAVNKIPAVREEFERALGTMPQSMVTDLVNPVITESGKKSWKFTEAGRRYMEGAALAHVLTDARALDLAGQYPVISDGLTRSFGALRSLSAKIASGELSQAWDFTPRIKAALELQKWGDGTKAPLKAYFAQTTLQGARENIPTLHPELLTSQDKLSALFADAILTLKNKPKQLADLFTYLSRATEQSLTKEAAKDPAQALIDYMRSNPAFKKRAIGLDFDEVMQGYSLDKFTGTQTLGELAEISKGPLRDVPQSAGEVQAGLNEFKAYDEANHPAVAPLTPSRPSDTLLQHLETHPEAGRSIGSQADHDMRVMSGQAADDGYNEATTVLDEAMRRPGAGGLDRAGREMSDLPKFVDEATLTSEHIDEMIAHTQESVTGDPAKIKTPTAAKARRGGKRPPKPPVVEDGFDPNDVVSNGFNPISLFSRGPLGEHTRGPLWFLGTFGSDKGKLAWRRMNYAAVKTQDMTAALSEAFKNAVKGVAVSSSDSAIHLGRRLNLKDRLFSQMRAHVKFAMDETKTLMAQEVKDPAKIAASQARLKALVDTQDWLQNEYKLMLEYEKALAPEKKAAFDAATEKLEGLVNTVYAMHEKSAAAREMDPQKALGHWNHADPPDLRSMPLSWKTSRVMGGKGVRRFGSHELEPGTVNRLLLADKDALMNVGMFTEAGAGTYTHDIFEIYRAYAHNGAKKTFLDPVLNAYKTTQKKIPDVAGRAARRGIGSTHGKGLLTQETNPLLLELPPAERRFVRRWGAEMSGEKTGPAARMQERAYMNAHEYAEAAKKATNPAMRAWYETQARINRDVAMKGDPLMRASAAISGAFTRGLLAGSLPFYLKNGFQMVSLAEANPVALLAGVRNFTFSREGRQFAREAGINREVTFMLEQDQSFNNRMAEMWGHRGDPISAMREINRGLNDITTAPMGAQEFLNRGLAFHVGLADFMLKRKLGTMRELADSGFMDDAIRFAADFSDRHNGIFGVRGKNPTLQGNWFLRMAGIFSHYAGNQAELIASMAKNAIDDKDVGPILQYVLHTGWATSVAHRAGLDVTDWFGMWGARPALKPDPESPFFLSNAPFNFLKATVGTIAYGNPYSEGFDPGKAAESKTELYRSASSMLPPYIQAAASFFDRQEGTDVSLPGLGPVDLSSRYTRAWRAERQKRVQTSRGSTLAEYNGSFADRANAWAGVKSIKLEENRKLQRREYVEKSQRSVTLHETRAELTRAYQAMTDEKAGTKESRAEGKKKFLALREQLTAAGISPESQARAVQAELAKSEETILKFLKEDPVLPNGEADPLWMQEAEWYLRNGKRKDLKAAISRQLELVKQRESQMSP